MAEIKDYTIIDQNDEIIGQAHDFYFDDLLWTVRYLVIDTSTWLPGRKVLISPVALGPLDIGADLPLSVGLTKQQIEQSPSIDADKPISPQQEVELIEHYHWPDYWRLEKDTTVERSGDLHLRRAKEVIGYYIHARDGDIGHVEDFLVDDESWGIHYLIVDTRNWWPGKKVLVSPSWVEDINWHQSQVSLDLSRETVKNSPEYDPSR
jgi:hypothetical protein